MEAGVRLPLFHWEPSGHGSGGLYNGSRTIPAIINHLDALNHVRYTEDEVLDLLEGLKGEGVAEEKDGSWLYAKSHSKDGASFIF